MEPWFWPRTMCPTISGRYANPPFHQWITILPLMPGHSVTSTLRDVAGFLREMSMIAAIRSGIGRQLCGVAERW